MLQCKYCQKELTNLDSLRIHSSKSHNLSSQEVYDQYFLNGDRPKCKCGCGQDTPFTTLQKGYKEWVRGHISRVKNNWGHNTSAIDKSSETRRQQYKNGERIVWNAGLTKETDERVANYGKVGSMTILANQNEINRRKEQLRQQWATGNIIAEYGVQSHNWKGGTSSINNLVRANSRLYTDWIFPQLKKDEFRCVKCGNTKTLEVHHSTESMSQIISKFVDKTKEYTFDEKRDIMNKIIDYHINNAVIGETLCANCHTKLHPSYNL